jgi:hypothetical protein
MERVRQLHNAARFTAIAGIAYAILFLLSFWLLTDVPGAGSTTQEIVEFYQSDDSNVVTVVALYLFPFAGIAFLWFIVSLRMWISYRVDRPVSMLFSNIQLCSGIVFLCLFFASAAALSVNAVGTDIGGGTIDPLVAAEFPEFGNSLFFVFAIRMGAMFVFTTTNIGRASKILPTWFAVVGLVVGLVMLLSASFNRGLILVFPLWVMVLCLLILLHARQAVDRIEARVSESKEAVAAPADHDAETGAATGALSGSGIRPA